MNFNETGNSIDIYTTKHDSDTNHDHVVIIIGDLQAEPGWLGVSYVASSGL